MNIHFHRAVQNDVRLALEYFDREGGTKLGDRFFAEFEATKERVVANPTNFGFFRGDLRRAKLRVFAIMSSSELWEMKCVYWCCATTGDIPSPDWLDVKKRPSRRSQAASLAHL